MAEEGKTRRWQRFESSLDPLQALRSSIADVKANPRDPEARRRLRAIAAEQGMWDELAMLLSDEVNAASSPEHGAAFHEELADVHENLDQLLDAISAMERVVELAPSPRHHDRLGRLYHRAGATLKAAEAFEQVGLLGSGERALAALRAAATLFRDANRLDRAAGVLRGLLERRPADAMALGALDDVLQGQQRWRELAELRGERARRAESNMERATLLRGQARALEQDGDLTAAAEVVARAAKHAPENVSGLVDYADVLARSGEGRQAADILTARVEDAIVRQAAVDDIAALRLRLATILDDTCGDPAAATAVLEQLVTAAPSYLPAREWMAARAAADPDPRVHAAALLRYAAVLPDTQRCAIVIAAARRFRDGEDHPSAVRAFEHATELDPDNDDIRAELEAARVAMIVVRATADRDAGDLASAERKLRTVLKTQPLHVDANLALSKVLGAAGRHTDAAEHLRGALADAPADQPGERTALLVQELARMMAALGEVDEAHQLLHEAHRLDRRSLVLTLALGESYFARKIWRQAALHLGGLATHADAKAHPAAVAHGLVHAALAEVRALRPANAEKHYRAAVELDPQCAPAWHALAELAMERGELASAADCLEREATATTTPADRLRLFDALGDMAREVLQDPGRAERCWMAIADAGSASVLEKLLGVLRERDAGIERATVAEKLAALTTDAKARTALLVEAAVGPNGQALAERLMAESPRDIDALLAATAIASRDSAQVLRWLQPALKALGPTDIGPKHSELWRRLGDAERDRENELAALAAYQRAVASAPDSDGAVAARRAMVELAATTGEQAKSSLIALVELQQDPFDILAWARGLARSGEHDDARAGYELARAIDAKLTGTDEDYLASHPPRVMASDEAYSEPLGEVQRAELVGDADDGPLAELLELLAEAGPLVAPDTKTVLAAHGLSDARRLPASSEVGAVAVYPQIAKAFGGPPTLLHATPSTEVDLMLLFASPVVLVLGPSLAAVRAGSRSDLDLSGDGRLRFQLGRVVELARPRRLAATGQPLASFVRMLALVARACGTDTGDPGLAAEADKLRSRLPIGLRTKLTDLLITIAPSERDEAACRVYRAACERAADRVGLLACGDASVAVPMAGGPDRAPHLVQLAASQRYLAARRKLRSKITPGEATAPFAK